jgi:hypothetical protein
VQREGLDVDLTGELNEWFKRQVENNLHRGGIENVVFRMWTDMQRRWTDVQRGEHFRTRDCNADSDYPNSGPSYTITFQLL